MLISSFVVVSLFDVANTSVVVDVYTGFTKFNVYIIPNIIATNNIYNIWKHQRNKVGTRKILKISHFIPTHWITVLSAEIYGHYLTVSKALNGVINICRKLKI